MLQNPVEYVLRGLEPVAKHKYFLLDIKILNSDAMTALMKGSATKTEIDRLIAMSNMAEILQSMGFGKEFSDVAQNGRQALISIVHRAIERGTFIPKGEEVKALNELMELHDAQLDVITVKDMEKALDTIEKRKVNLTILPSIPESLR